MGDQGRPAAAARLGGRRVGRPQKEMGAGIAASPHCAERRICRCSVYLVPPRKRFVTPRLDPGSPAQASLPIEPLPLARSPTGLLGSRPGGSLSFDPSGLAWKPRFPSKTVRCSAALLGMPSTVSRFAHCPRPLRRGWKSGAASHDRKTSLPAPLPGWPRIRSEEPQHCLPAEIGPLVTCRPVLPLPAFWRGRDRRPDHLVTMHMSAESQKRKIR
jgi:hypothetical protein